MCTGRHSDANSGCVPPKSNILNVLQLNDHKGYLAKTLNTTIEEGVDLFAFLFGLFILGIKLLKIAFWCEKGLSATGLQGETQTLRHEGPPFRIFSYQVDLLTKCRKLQTNTTRRSKASLNFTTFRQLRHTLDILATPNCAIDTSAIPHRFALCASRPAILLWK